MHAIHESLPISFPNVVSLAPVLYADANERSRHQHTMAQLAEETDWPLQMIEPIYEQTLARLKTSATIQDYLPILVAKGVKSALKELARQH